MNNKYRETYKQLKHLAYKLIIVNILAVATLITMLLSHRTSKMIDFIVIFICAVIIGIAFNLLLSVLKQRKILAKAIEHEDIKYEDMEVNDPEHED